jgi:hypothetical protein
MLSWRGAHALELSPTLYGELEMNIKGNFQLYKRNNSWGFIINGGDEEALSLRACRAEYVQNAELSKAESCIHRCLRAINGG